VYISIRDKFPNSLLLESSDYHGVIIVSLICCNPIFHKNRNETFQKLPTASRKVAIDANTNIPEVIQEFSGQFKSEKTTLNLSIFGFVYFL
jgi:anthranilate synthase component 1